MTDSLQQWHRDILQVLDYAEFVGVMGWRSWAMELAMPESARAMFAELYEVRKRLRQPR